MLKRKYFAFLSHAHADGEAVNRIHSWLRDVASVPIWFDAVPPGTLVASTLAEAIVECRAMIIVLSESSIRSRWVEQEYNAAIGQDTEFGRFRIIPVRIEECTVPGFLSNYRWIDIFGGQLDLRSATELLDALYINDARLDPGGSQDIYISRTWHTNEAPLADRVCRQLVRAGFRLIGDAPDQCEWDDTRVRSLISSSGAVAAILPYRNNRDTTSRFILQELRIALDVGLPRLIVAEPNVRLPAGLDDGGLKVEPSTTDDATIQSLLSGPIEWLKEEWRRPARPHYIFYATDLDERVLRRNEQIARVLQVVTAMPCVLGQQVRRHPIQLAIAKSISDAALVIADITDFTPDGQHAGAGSRFSINVCIEAGIALGTELVAGRAYTPDRKIKLQLLARWEQGPNLPFMFRDMEIGYYRDDVELLGIVHRIAFPYRRRVLNYEFST